MTLTSTSIATEFQSEILKLPVQTFKETYFKIPAHPHTLQDYKRADIYLERTIAALGVSMSTWGNGDENHLLFSNKRISQALPRKLTFSMQRRRAGQDWTPA